MAAAKATTSLKKGKRAVGAKIPARRPFPPACHTPRLIRGLRPPIMAILAENRRAAGRRAVMALPLLALFGLAVLGLGYVIYALWPRWPDAPVPADAPPLPVVIGGVRFNVPPQAIRAAVQRRAGTQERLDLVYLWPSLEPPGPAAATAGLAERDRVFVTITASAALPPVERLKNIYPRYIAPQPSPAPPGLSVVG